MLCSIQAIIIKHSYFMISDNSTIRLFRFFQMYFFDKTLILNLVSLFDNIFRRPFQCLEELSFQIQTHFLGISSFLCYFIKYLSIVNFVWVLRINLFHEIFIVLFIDYYSLHYAEVIFLLHHKHLIAKQVLMVLQLYNFIIFIFGRLVILIIVAIILDKSGPMPA